MQAAALVLFYTTQAQQLLESEGLDASPPPAGLWDCQHRDSQEPTPAPNPVLPSPRTHPAEEPVQPFPRSRLPLAGALGTDKAGTMLAAQQPGSLLGAGAKAKQEQLWRPGRRDGPGQQRGRRCLHPPSSALSSWGGGLQPTAPPRAFTRTSQHLFPHSF